MSVIAVDFNRDSFFEQGFRFTRVSERTWSVESLESWDSLEEHWVSIGRVMEAKKAPTSRLGSWVAIGDCIYVGFPSRADAAQHLERIRYE